MSDFFAEIDRVPFLGPDSDDPLAFRFYEPDRMVLGKRMEDHLRCAICYWHSFAWPGSDPFGGQTFDRPWFDGGMEAARLKAEVAFEMFAILGAPFFTFHDRDVAPEGRSLAESSRNLREIADVFATRMADTGVKLLWGTANMFSHPRFSQGAATSPNADAFAYAAAQVKKAIEVTHELGGENYVFWGGREGSEVDASKNPLDTLKWFREALNFLNAYNREQGYNFKFALEAKPNEPRADIYMPTTGAYLSLIATLDHPEMVGVNPEVAHEHMAGLNMMHAVAQAWEMGKLFHIDLNDQIPGRYDQDLRFGSANPCAAFWLVKFLEDVKYDGPRHFDAHAYRTEDYEGVKDFARGCMRTYLILKDKAAQWNADPEIKSIMVGIGEMNNGAPIVGKFSKEELAALLAHSFDRSALAAKKLPYERLDQLTMDILLGVR